MFMKISKWLFFAFLTVLLSACQQDEEDIFTPNNDGGTTMEDIPDPLSGEELAEARVELGRLLFFDPILSGGMDVACATCHHPDFGYADGRALSIGINATGLGPNRTHNSPNQEGFVRRNAPTVINTAFNGMDEDGNFNPNNAPNSRRLHIRPLFPSQNSSCNIRNSYCQLVTAMFFPHVRLPTLLVHHWFQAPPYKYKPVGVRV